jgi:hypothetical protein
MQTDLCVHHWSKQVSLNNQWSIDAMALRTGWQVKACNCGKNDDQDAGMTFEHTPRHYTASRSSVNNTARKSPRRETPTP